MKYGKLFFAIITLIYVTYAFAEEARYVKRGKYFKVDRDKYWVKGVRDVKGLGTYGRKFGGILVRNGFEANGNLGVITEYEARIAQATGKTILRVAASGDVGIEGIESLKPLDGDFEENLGKDTQFSIIVVSPGNWENVYERLLEKYENGDSGLRKRFQDDEFRLIDSVVYATNFRVDNISNVEAALEVGQGTPVIKLSGELDGKIIKQGTYELTKKQIIAYSFRRLCWDDGIIVSARIDNPGPSDTSNCDEYDD